MLKLEEQDLKRIVDEIWARISPLLGGGEGEFLPLTGGKLTGDVTVSTTAGDVTLGKVSGQSKSYPGLGTSGEMALKATAVRLCKNAMLDPIILAGIKTPTNSDEAVPKSYADDRTPTQGSVTVSCPAGWSSWGELYRTKVTIPKVTSAHRVDFYMDYAVEQKLQAPIRPYNDSGTVYAVSAKVPDSDITVQYVLTLQK